jgi:hypothetical protein
MNPNGIAWSLDAVTASVIALITIALLFSTAAQEAIGRENRMKEKNLIVNSLNWSDSIVKRHDESNALFGAAHYSFEKKRVESHWVEMASLKKSFPEKRGAFYMASLSMKSNGTETVFWNQPKSENCVARNRFVMVLETKQKGVLHTVVCVEP